MLSLFTALLIRLARDILHRKAPVLLPEAGRMRKSEKFGRTRLCQWTYQLDRGSLVCFRGVARALGQSGPSCAVSFDAAALTPQQWGKLLCCVGWGATVLAEGMGHERAVCGGKLNEDITKQPLSELSGRPLRTRLEPSQAVVEESGAAGRAQECP